MLRPIATLALALFIAAPASTWASSCGDAWDEWAEFQTDMISSDGRVIDKSDPRRITTSEGQSYAMFFALVDNDPILFRRLLRWTEANLAQGDLTSYLPAWLWGSLPSGQSGVLDANSASDADLWIAYSLLEAGRLWNEHSYSALGTLLLQRIGREEVVDLPGFGQLLLPGKSGFAHKGSWLFNPSYLPPQLIAHAATVQPIEPWLSMVDNTYRFLIESSPEGLVPDWISWTGERFEALSLEERIGSYDAIRVYFWAGTLHPKASGASRLKQHFRAVANLITAEGRVPEHIDIYESSGSGLGPEGFSVAVLPLLAENRSAQALESRLSDAGSGGRGYYNRVLHLFGQGWAQGRYRFDKDGFLMPRWTLCR